MRPATGSGRRYGVGVITSPDAHVRDAACGSHGFHGAT
jgi:hypothetical protein